MMGDLVQILNTLLAAVAGLKPEGMPLALEGIWDEIGHLATVALLLVPFRSRLSRPFAVAALAMGVLIDLDHIPLYLGLIGTPEGAARPISHSLAPVALLGMVALIARGRVRLVLSGAAFGIAAHLLRDMATGGVVLFWPVDLDSYEISYPMYAAILLGVMVLITLQEFLGRLQRGLGSSRIDVAPREPIDR
jgi:inner membrane protein